MKKLGILGVLALLLAMALPMAGVGANPGPGIVGLWHLDEGIGPTAYDSSGNVNDGTVFGATYVPGKFHQALSFVGSNDYVEVGDASELRFGAGDSITIEAWVQPSAATALGVIVQKGGITDHNTNYVLRQAGAKVDFFYRGTDNSWHGVRTSNDVLTVDQWDHVAVTYSFGTPAAPTIYVNGIPRAVWWPWPGWANPKENDQSLRFGGLNYWGQKYYGLIDEVRIWDRALIADEIKASSDMGTGSADQIKEKDYVSDFVVFTSHFTNGTVNISIASSSGSRTISSVSIEAVSPKTGSATCDGTQAAPCTLTPSNGGRTVELVVTPVSGAPTEKSVRLRVTLDGDVDTFAVNVALP